MSDRTALVLGATGLIGRHVVELLLADPTWSRVRVLVRRPLALAHEKLEVQVLDFEQLPDHSELFAVDDIFCCLGTTMKVAKSREAFRRVDLDYPTDAARFGRVAGAKQYLLVSSTGANPHSMFFYNRVKGELEQKLRTAGYPSLSIFQPSLLLGARETPRMLERVAEVGLALISWLFVGPLSSLRPVQGEQVARAMVNRARRAPDGTRVLSFSDIRAEAG